MREVALKAGVSQATVSRVLNGSTTVRDASRSRVLAAVDELQYRPNRLARNLRRRRADMIGILVSDIENPHFTEMVRAVEDAAYRKGYRVLLCNTDESADKQRAYLEVLAQERPLGVLLSPTHPGGPEIAELLDEGIPVVAFDRVVDDPRADAVVADNVAAARLATTHLVEGGHRRIGFVGGPADIETGAERRQGYEEAMRAAGLEPLAEDGRFRIDAGRLATARLLGVRPAPTALVVANNLMTIGALKALREADASVPSDVALVAIDDPFWAELTEPPLTALAQPVRRMAHEAMSLLLDRIGHRRRRARRIVLDFALRVRRSCGRQV
jgi:DNA-binding LacI/PurR family transcriptional regulator